MSRQRLPMTTAQIRVYDCARAFSSKHGYPPTRAEIADLLGMSSPNSVEQHLRAIAEKGWIEMPRGKTRNIVFCGASEGKPHTERDSLRAEVERLREIREIASQCAANGGCLNSRDLIKLRELLEATA